MEKVIAVFTNSLRYEAVPELRLFGPLSLAGYKVIDGNELTNPNRKIDLQGVDFITIQRDFPRNWGAYNDLISAARHASAPVIYDVDDLLWELPAEHPNKQGSTYTDALLPMWLAAATADLVTVSTPALLSYVKSINPNVSLLPNYLNDQIWSFNPPKYRSDAALPVVVGYMGSYTHDPDIKMILPTLTHLLKEYDQKLIVRFLGLSAPAELRHFSNVEASEAWCASYSEFATGLSNWSCDICIAPLISNLFNRSKSPIKFFEYSCIGAAGVYASIDPYQWVVANGVSGFLASAQEEWYFFLKRLIDEPKLRYEMALAAQKTVQEKWTLSSHVNEWKEVYENMKSASSFYTKDTIYATKSLTSITGQIQDLMAERQRAVQMLSAQVAEKEQALSAIESSRAWKIVQHFRKVKAFFNHDRK